MSNLDPTGYERGYREVSCFWGKQPGSLVRDFVDNNDVKDMKVLDIGAGEGKNAFALASKGASVTAVEISESAIANGKKAFVCAEIFWMQCDILNFVLPEAYFDLVVNYGLIHCLASKELATLVIQTSQRSIAAGGWYIFAAFNNGPHDLSAHPGFNPLLLSHDHFLSLFEEWDIVTSSDSILREAHPHNNIEHYHSLSRIMARKR